MWNKWKCLRKWLFPNYNVFRGPKWTGNWASEANIRNEHAKQYWCETRENILRKWPKTYLGVQNGPKIGPVRPIFYLPLEVATMNMWNNTNVKPTESSTVKNRYLGPISGSQNWAFEAHIVHISESSSNHYRKQDWCEFRGNCFTK